MKAFYVLNRFDGGINSKDVDRTKLVWSGPSDAVAFGSSKKDRLVGTVSDVGFKSKNVSLQPDPRDKQENELTEAVNIMVDSVGQIRTIGAFDEIDSPTNLSPTEELANYSVDGYGLHYYSADWTVAGANTREDYLLIADTQAADINRFSYGANAWSTGVINLGSTAGAKCVYTQADGVVRVSDANLGAANQPRWYGYIVNNHFGNAIAGWYDKSTALTAPTKGIYGRLFFNPTTGSSQTAIVAALADTFKGMTTGIIGHYATYNGGVTLAPTVSAYVDTVTVTADLGVGSTWNDAEYVGFFPPSGTGFNLTMATNADGEWEAGTYEFAETFIYENNQESLPFTMVGNGFIVADNTGIDFNVNVTYDTASKYNERIIGGRIYYRIQSSSDDWKLLADISMKNGVRTGLAGSYVAWVSYATNSTRTFYSTVGYDGGGYLQSISPNIDTYESINGFPQTEPTISFDTNGQGWKWSCMGGRRAFYIAAKYKDTEGNSKWFQDRIYYSLPNKFDTVPTSNYIDIGINDGDEFIAGEVYADRLLAFKRNILYIINISNPSPTQWFKEAEFLYKGIEQPSAMCRTDVGIIWTNTRGCFLYDGEKINDLTDKIDDTEWGTDWVASTSMIGYIPYKQQILITKAMKGTTAGYIYDMRTQSWVESDDIFYGVTATGHSAAGKTMQYGTNFVIDKNGDLIIGCIYTNTLVYAEICKWSDASSAIDGQIMTTRDVDFEDPGHVKRVYKVYITYKSSVAQTTPFEYVADGGTSFTDFNKISVGGSEDTVLDVATVWDVATIRHSSNFPLSCQSLKIRVNPASAGTININDITIEYRPIWKRVS